jgi:hypothetical protein
LHKAIGVANLFLRRYKGTMNKSLAEIIQDWLLTQEEPYDEIAKRTKVSLRTLRYLAEGRGTTLRTAEKLLKHIPEYQERIGA